MNTKLLTTCLLAGALLLPMAGHTADSGQTDPGYIEPWLMPPYTADNGQTDPGYIAATPMTSNRTDGGTDQIEIEGNV
jgi:hypothetical protein